MNQCIACQRINEGADPMTLSLIHTCHAAPVIDYVDQAIKALKESAEVDFALKADPNNVISLPVDDKEFEKDQLLFGLTSAIHNLQRFVTVNSLRIFTPWEIANLEESRDNLMILVELFKEKNPK